MKIMPFRAVAPNLDKVPHSNDFFDTVKYRYHEYAAEGLFLPTEDEAMYIYQIKSPDGQKRNGLVVATDIEEYFKGTMKQHEKTIETNEVLQSELLQTRGAAIKPVLLTYPPISELNELISNYIETHKKFYVIELDTEKHRFWKITEGGVIDQIQHIFAEKIPHAYIADGHHRSASFAARHKKSPNDKTSKMLTAYFPENTLKIGSFHRVVKDLNGLTADDFLEKLRTEFKIRVLRAATLPYSKFEITMFLEDKWFQLYWRKEILKHYAEESPEGFVLLDVDLLNEKIIKPVLGITNIKTDPRLKYIDGQQEFEKLTNAVSTEGVGFCLFPVELDDLKAIVDREGTMPPKSTFFEPRMKNGLLVYEI